MILFESITYNTHRVYFSFENLGKAIVNAQTDPNPNPSESVDIRLVKEYKVEITNALTVLFKAIKELEETPTCLLTQKNRKELSDDLNELHLSVSKLKYDEIELVKTLFDKFKSIMLNLQREAIQFTQREGIFSTSDVWQPSSDPVDAKNLVVVDFDWVDSTKFQKQNLEGTTKFISLAHGTLQACASKYGGLNWNVLGDKNVFAFESREEDSGRHMKNALRCAVEMLSLVKAANKIQNVNPNKFVLPVRITVQTLENFQYDPYRRDLDLLRSSLTELYVISDDKTMGEQLCNTIIVDQNVFDTVVDTRWFKGHIGLTPIEVKNKKASGKPMWLLTDIEHGTITGHLRASPSYVPFRVPAELHVNSERMKPSQYLSSKLVDEYGLSIQQIASQLDLSEQDVDDLLNDRKRIDQDLALRLDAVYSYQISGMSAHSLLHLQCDFDFDSNRHKITVPQLEPFISDGSEYRVGLDSTVA